jgi:hypothetical protein
MKIKLNILFFSLVKASDVEIESGIESDSSADQQVSEALAAAAAAVVVNSSLITKQTDDTNNKSTTTTTNNNSNCIAIREDQRGEEFLSAKRNFFFIYIQFLIVELRF